MFLIELEGNWRDLNELSICYAVEMTLHKKRVQDPHLWLVEGVNFPNLSPAIGQFGIQLGFHDSCDFVISKCDFVVSKPIGPYIA